MVCPTFGGGIIQTDGGIPAPHAGPRSAPRFPDHAARLRGAGRDFEAKRASAAGSAIGRRWLWIPLVVFSDNGKKRETIQVQKIVKSDAEWQRELTPEEFAVARKQGTERAFTGLYWNNHEAGMYRCACCGTELFL